MVESGTDSNGHAEVITFVRPRTGKTYERINGVWHLNGRPIPEGGKGNRAAQWQIEEEYQACKRDDGERSVVRKQ